MEDFMITMALLNIFLFLPIGGIVAGCIMSSISRRKKMARAVGYENGEIIFEHGPTPAAPATHDEISPRAPPQQETAPEPAAAPEPAVAPEPAITPNTETFENPLEESQGEDTSMEEPDETPPPPRRSRTEWLKRLEQVVGRHWTTWVGVAALFAGAVFFVKFAIEHGWFGPTTRVIMGGALGALLVGAGERFIRRSMGALGKGLIGGGLAMIYLSIFSAYSLYDLIPTWVAFGTMVLVAAGGMALSIRHDALPISIISTACGFLVPVMLGTGLDNRDGLFAYVLILDAAVLSVALFKRWRILDVTAFVGTWALFGLWYFEHFTEAQLWASTAWLGGFFGLFLIIPFVHHWRQGTPITGERFAMTVGNATATFLLAYGLMGDRSDNALGLFTIGMSACYLALAVFTGRRTPEDRKSIFTFTALSITLLTIASPILLDFNELAVAWAVEGVLIAWLAFRYNYLPARVGGFVAICLAIIQALVMDTSAGPQISSAAPFLTGTGYSFVNAQMFTGLFVALATALFAVVIHQNSDKARTTDRVLERITGLAAPFLAMIVLSRETYRWADATGHFYEAMAIMPAIWTIGFAALAAAGERVGSKTARVGAFVSLGIATGMATVAYMDDPSGSYYLVANLRFAAAAAPIAAMLVYSRLAVTEIPARVMSWLFAGMLLCLLSTESYLFFHNNVSNYVRAEWAAQMSLSIVWAVYAAGALAIGFIRKVRPLRLSALALFGVTATKLTFMDLAELRDGYRIISFVVLGVLLIGASYAYHRAEKMFETSEAEAA